MDKVWIGDIQVGRLGFGAMHLSGDAPWEPPPPRETAMAVLRRAVEAGVQLIDTADSYGLGHNEELIAAALHPYRDGVVIATKAGQSRPGGRWVPLGRPEYLRQQVELSLMRLRFDALDLFQLHRVDPTVDFDEQMATLAGLVEDGKVRRIGLSQVSVAELERARRTVEVVSVQNKYSYSDRRDEDVLTYCEREGIAFIPWRPLGLSRADAPRVDRVAAGLGATRSQAALAWLLARSPAVVPIPGTADPAHLEENLAARSLVVPADLLL